MNKLDLFPEPKTPYYIWMPPWDANSSGIRCLHLLCHALNESGQRAYLVPVNSITRSNPALNTPLLNEEHNYFYHNHNIDPIVIYPEIVSGNPFKGEKVVRWLLAPAGLYGGDKVFPETDKVFGYTKDLHPDVLCLPTFNEKIFHPPSPDSKREGNCFYAHKYRTIHNNALLPITNGMTQCIGTAEQVAEILRKHKKCYVYERSEILVTAKMCGCEIEPVITEYWDGKLPEEFFDAQGDLVPQFLLRYHFKNQLAKFIEATQNWRVNA